MSDTPLGTMSSSYETRTSRSLKHGLSMENTKAASLGNMCNSAVYGLNMW